MIRDILSGDQVLMCLKMGHIWKPNKLQRLQEKYDDPHIKVVW